MLNGGVNSKSRGSATHVCCIALDNDALRRFWKIEDHNLQQPVFSQEEQAVIRHFEQHHEKDTDRRYIVLLSTKENVTPLGDSKSQALQRFKTMERALQSKETFSDFAEVVQEYFKMGHAELVAKMEVVSPRTEVSCTMFRCTPSTKKKVPLASSVWYSMHPQSWIQQHHSTITC